MLWKTLRLENFNFNQQPSNEGQPARPPDWARLSMPQRFPRRIFWPRELSVWHPGMARWISRLQRRGWRKMDGGSLLDRIVKLNIWHLKKNGVTGIDVFVKWSFTKKKDPCFAHGKEVMWGVNWLILRLPFCGDLIWGHCFSAKLRSPEASCKW